MVQLGLPLQERLPYDGKKFIVHSGIRAMMTDAEAAVRAAGFSCRCYVGGSRFGKTHCSLAVGEMATATGRTARFLDGESFHRWLTDSYPFLTLSRFDLIVIDDVDQYFSKLQPGGSGPFVSFYETVRRADGKIFLFSGKEIETFPVDDHCMSRLRASLGPSLDVPSQEDLVEIVQSMARQRGIRLKEKKLTFITRRIRRDIAAVEEYLQRVLHLSKLFGSKIKYPLLGDAV